MTSDGMVSKLLRELCRTLFLYFVSKELQLQYIPVKNHVKGFGNNSFMKLTILFLYCSVDKRISVDKM